MVENVPPQQRLPFPLRQPFPVHFGRVFGSRPLPRDLRVRHVPLQHPLPLPVHGNEAVEVDVVPDRPRARSRRRSRAGAPPPPFPATPAAADPAGTASPAAGTGRTTTTTLASVHSPQAAPASAARGVDGSLIQRTDSHTANVVNSSSVGSWRTNTTRVTSKGFTASKSAAGDGPRKGRRRSRGTGGTPPRPLPRAPATGTPPPRAGTRSP